MDNRIKFLETEKYTPQQISNPKLNLNFEPINPVEIISGYQRLYRPEDSSQQSSENSEVSTPQEETTQSGNSSKRTINEPVQETVQAKPISEQQMHIQEAVESENGKIYTNQQDFVEDMTAAYTKALAARGISTDYAKMLVAQDALESN